MERFTVSLSDALATEFDQWIAARGYSNRSEAFRDLLRHALKEQQLADDSALYSVATLSYVYNHHERNLAERLTQIQHDAHEVVVSSMHVHLDHDDCLETLFLRGLTARIRLLAETLSAETAVRHAALNLVPLALKPLQAGQLQHHGLHGHSHG